MNTKFQYFVLVLLLIIARHSLYGFISREQDHKDAFAFQNAVDFLETEFGERK